MSLGMEEEAACVKCAFQMMPTPIQEEEDVGVGPPRNSYAGASSDVLNDIPDQDKVGVASAWCCRQCPRLADPLLILPPPAPHLQESDPLAMNKQRQIMNRMDEYHRRVASTFLYSPVRQDPFADGKAPLSPLLLSFSLFCPAL